VTEDRIAVHWFRRDLRLKDNASLYHALNSGWPVLCIFIFDTNILKLLETGDARVSFIHEALCLIKEALEKKSSTLLVARGVPEEVFASILSEFPVGEVHANRDYEPYAAARDARIASLLNKAGVPFLTHKDQCIFEPGEIRKDNGDPYTVFTPYFRRWQKTLDEFSFRAFPSEQKLSLLWKTRPRAMPSLTELGFVRASIPVPSPVPKIQTRIIETYGRTRNDPGIQGTTRLGVHLRFGTISIRAAARAASNQVFLSELAWRDFFMMILHEFPHSADRAFKPQYDRISWRDDAEGFRAWCEGRTGYPLVDAGMRELAQTGFMHNRVRMVAASFLCKHLLIDWRKGERWFAGKLLDFDLSANAGNWQWAAGSGCDAAPYFRIFNPQAQEKKFDPERLYIGKWLSPADLAQKPIVEHGYARERCLSEYKRALQT
jgi:deoxyribodipyrimidine photo-lyase